MLSVSPNVIAVKKKGRSLTPKILRPTGLKYLGRLTFHALKILRPKNWLSALFPEFFFLQSELSALIFGA